MAQAGQPTSGPKKPGFNWTRLIVSLVIITGIVLFIVWMMGGFSHSTEVKSFSDFFSHSQDGSLQEISKDGTIVHYVKIDEASNAIHYKVKGTEYIAYGIDHFRELFVNLHGEKVADLATKNSIQHAGASLPIEDAITYAAPVHKSAWSGILLNLLISFLPVMLLIGAMIWMMKRQGGEGSPFSPGGKNPAKKIISQKRFSDIAGQAEVKEEIEEVVDFLKNPKKYKAAGARIPKGIMLGGPPGTGKTLVAKATAGEAGVPFYFISASNFVEMFAGLGAKRVRTIFQEARKNAPAILFIDEMDAIGRKRGSSLSGNDEREQTLNQILVEMDGMDENTGLLVLAATNRLDVLDPALLRPGRFDRTVTMNNPDIKEREAILKLHARGKRIESSVDFAQVAKRVPGYSGAQLENIINEAALLSVREDTGVITLPQIDEAIDRVAAGPAKKHRVITPEELKMVAYHEAGHAVIGLKVASSQTVQKITIIPRGNAGGYNLMTPKKETYNHKKSELEAVIMSFMGGRAAEQIIYGKGEVSTGASNDIQNATNIARAMVTQYGMSSLGPIAYEKPTGSQFLGPDGMQKDYSESMSQQIDEAVRELVISAEKKAIEVVKKNKKLLELIKDELLDKETIVVEEIDYINKHLKRPPKRVVKKIKKSDKDLQDIINEVNQEGKAAESKDSSKTSSEKSTSKTQVSKDSKKPEVEKKTPSKKTEPKKTVSKKVETEKEPVKKDDKKDKDISKDH